MRTLNNGPRVARRTPDGFDDRPYTSFAVAPLTPTIGAEITGIDLRQPVDAALQAELRRALLEWKVLFFRDQNLTRDDHRRFASLWGPLEQHPFFKYVQPGQTASDVVTLAKDAATAGQENEWHTDITWFETPSFGAVLRAIELPPVGGDTLWADTAAAYDGLDDDTKAAIEHAVAVHDWRFTFGAKMDPAVRDQLVETFPPTEHPVVRIHPETGRRTIFVNRIFTQHIVGMDPDSSDRLLATVESAVHAPEYQCRFRWTPGAIAFWDNRATQHYASSDYFPARRVMDRVSIVGDRPYGPSAPE
jgi:taurine dioxygenase